MKVSFHHSCDQRLDNLLVILFFSNVIDGFFASFGYKSDACFGNCMNYLRQLISLSMSYLSNTTKLITTTRQTALDRNDSSKNFHLQSILRRRPESISAYIFISLTYIFLMGVYKNTMNSSGDWLSIVEDTLRNNL